MSNFSPKIEDAPDDRLKHWTNETNPHYASLASDELTRRTLNKLQETIQVFNEQSSKQTEKMIRVTNLIAVLTFVMVIGLIVQLYLAKIQTQPILFEQQKNEYQAYKFCKDDPKSEWPSATGGKVSCQDVLQMLKEKFESNI